MNRLELPPQHDALHTLGVTYGTNLRADYFHRGRHQGHVDLGSGLITNAGVVAMANDFAWASPATVVNTIGLSNWHASGTGVTAAAATNIKLQTPSTNGGETPVAGAQSLLAAASTTAQYRTVATIAYTGAEAVTEWSLLSDNFLTDTTGSPFTATSATGGTATATPYTASSATVKGEQHHIVETTTTPRWGLIVTNTTSVLTIPAWYVTSSGAGGSTPGPTETFTLRPVMWDHKVFAAINVVASDSIQFTYTLTISSGG